MGTREWIFDGRSKFKTSLWWSIRAFDHLISIPFQSPTKFLNSLLLFVDFFINWISCCVSRVYMIIKITLYIYILVHMKIEWGGTEVNSQESFFKKFRIFANIEFFVKKIFLNYFDRDRDRFSIYSCSFSIFLLLLSGFLYVNLLTNNNLLDIYLNNDRLYRQRSD